MHGHMKKPGLVFPEAVLSEARPLLYGRVMTEGVQSNASFVTNPKTSGKHVLQ